MALQPDHIVVIGAGAEGMI